MAEGWVSAQGKRRHHYIVYTLSDQVSRSLCGQYVVAIESVRADDGPDANGCLECRRRLNKRTQEPPR